MPEKKETPPAKKKAAAKSTTKKSTAKTAKKKKTVAKAAAPKAAAPETTTAQEAAPRAKKKSAGKLRVRQIRSTIHKPKTFKRTLVALGLKHHQDETVVLDSPSTRGMLTKVRHLVSVTPEDS